MLNNNRIDFRLGNKIYMGILSTREWATVIWAFIFFVYAMVHRQIREAFWKVVKIFFGKKLRILWGIILLYVLGITLIFYHLPFWDNVYIKDIIVWFLFSGLIYCMNAVSQEADEEYIRKVLNEHRSLKLEGFPTFTGGLVGYFSFDYFKYSEPSIIKNQKDNGFNDVDLMLFDKVICFDHFKQKLILIVNIGTNDLQKNYKEGIKELDELDYIIRKHVKTLVQPLKLLEDFKPVLSKKEYCQMVEKGIDYIKEGDIFQVVLSNRLYAKATGSLFDSYRVLRTTNPSPYMFYFASDNIEVAGASPETLIKLEGTKLTTFPIAGTRKRGKDDQEDQQLIDDLLKDEKELAEHNMLVDLGRNDLGRISKFNSVHVVSYMDILKFSKVIHIASIVSSEIKEKYDALDAVDALLPAGTLSGAPKIRACQIINQLEQNKRGIYGGAIGYLDFTGNMDLCIGIRLAYKRNNEISICSGAGIVYDSVPENEYQECLNKAGAVVEAIKMADGGIDYDSTH